MSDFGGIQAEAISFGIGKVADAKGSRRDTETLPVPHYWLAPREAKYPATTCLSHLPVSTIGL